MALREGPIRTCVGCRRRVPAEELLRVVVARDSSPTASDPLELVPDPRRRRPGRGAWVHPDGSCVELAVRRRAFARALRVPATVSATRVGEYVAETSDGSDADTFGAAAKTRRRYEQ